MKTNIVFFSVTDFCNARCKTCSFWKTKKPTYPLSDPKQLAKAIRTKLDCGYLHITGGEPLTYPQIIEFITAAKAQGMVVQLMTNGYLLNEAKIKKLAKAKLDLIGFSVDHYDEAVVYANRKLPKLLQKLRHNLSILKSTNITTYAGITLAKHNFNELEKTAQFAIDMGFDCIYFSLPVSLHGTFKLGNNDNDSIDFTDAQMIQAVNTIIELKKKHGNKVTHNMEFLKEMKNFYAKQKQTLPCKAGQNLFYIDNHLEVYDCMVKETKLGKITGQVKRLKNITCYDCPLQCNREGSMFFYGFRSIPFYIHHIINPHNWKLIKNLA
ncbi:MAG: radical SAM protein [Candidatus Woesearchaeota archaeon]